MLFKILLAMVAFAANSILCKIALKGMHIDEISFSSMRIISGAFALYLFMRLNPRSEKPAFNWINASLLSTYIFAFSVAYVSLSTATGALILFGTVQLVMTGWGMIRGEKLTPAKIAGILGALAGIGLLLLPGAKPPPVTAALMMMLSGIAWAVYCITGKAVTNAPAATAGNFILSVPIALLGALLHLNSLQFDITGLLLSIVAGAVTSGGAYLLWYSLLPKLSPTTASTIQLSVPCLAALGGVLFMGESFGLQIASSTVIILSSIGLVIWSDRK